jgi:hypothetical protein
MALAVNRTGVVFKRCDTSNDRPETVKQCAPGTCQHTCKPDTIEKCKHAWTLRYWVNGRRLRSRSEMRSATGGLSTVRAASSLRTSSSSSP